MEFLNNVLWKIVLTICFFVFVNCQTYNGDSCLTPNNEYGVCISIKNCKYLSDQYANVPKPLNTDQINTIQNHHCGFDISTPKVCCPPDNSPNRFSSTTTNVVHRNLGLINQNNCGGKVQSLAQYPWMALIAYIGADGTKFRCSGSLINENYILTAAQCITNLKSYSITTVRLGEYNLQTEIDCYHPRGCAPKVQDLLVSETIPHPFYNPNTMENDIGLLRLNSPANVQIDTVKPICLPISSNESDSLIGKEGTVTGWGTAATGYTNKLLLKISLPILSKDDCQSRYNERNARITITDNQICAGGIQGKDTCSGDGGAPLGLTNSQGIFIQHGIVSFGSRYCGTENIFLPGVYTKVSKYINWILDNIRA